MLTYKNIRIYFYQLKRKQANLQDNIQAKIAKRRPAQDKVPYSPQALGDTVTIPVLYLLAVVF
jgi:hypothetical protein